MPPVFPARGDFGKRGAVFERLAGDGGELVAPAGVAGVGHFVFLAGYLMICFFGQDGRIFQDDQDRIECMIGFYCPQITGNF
jgi:hypothetical protein